MGDVSIAEGRVAGALEMSGSRFNGDLNLGGLQLEGSLYMQNTSFGPMLALIGTSVRGDVRYGGGKPPGRVNLVGFSYERILFTKIAERSADNRGEAPFDWAALYNDLLSRQESHSPQPYQHLASVLRRTGDAEMAKLVLHHEAKLSWEGKKSERMENLRRKGEAVAASDWFGTLRIYLNYVSFWIGASVEWLYGLVVGFGHYPQRAILWVALFTVLGACVLHCSEEARKKGVAWCLGASLDQLLPIVELNQEFGNFFNDPNRERLRGWQLAYFAFQALVGFVLASFVVAGLSGLTATG